MSAASDTAGADFRLDGRVAVITGGSRGLGLAIARAFAQNGASLVLASRDARTLAAARASLPAAAPVQIHVTDAGDEASVAALDRFVAERFGRVDVLVANAGINGPYQGAETLSLEDWNRVLAVNLTGLFLASRTFGPRMIGAGGGSIIAIGSIAGRVALPKVPAYCASKAAVEGLVRALALDWARHQVRVNALVPGGFDTEMTQPIRANDKAYRRFVDRIPFRRLADPSELAGAALLLASPAGRYITGQSIVVDGGWTSQGL